MKLSLLFFIIVVVFSCNSKYQLHEHYISDAYEKSIDTVVFVPYRQGDKWFYVDRRTKGPYAGHEKAFGGEWEEAYPFNRSKLAKVKTDNGWAFIDTSGKEKITIRYKGDLQWNFIEGTFFLPGENDKYCLINCDGNILTNFAYSDFGIMQYGKALVYYEDNKVAVINKNGKTLIDTGVYSTINYNFNNDPSQIWGYGISVNNKTKFGFLDKNLNPLTEPIYDYDLEFRNDRGKVGINSKYGYIDKHGTTIIPLIYDEASVFNTDIAVVSQNGKYGAINKKGDIIIPIKFDYISNFGFKENISPVKKNNKYGIINSKGDIIVECKYNNVDEINNGYGLIAMERSGKWFMVDSLGNELIGTNYDASPLNYPISITPNRIVVLSNDNLKGIVNRKNKNITPMKYNIIESVEISGSEFHGLLRVVIHGKGLLEKSKEGYIDIWGKEYFED